MTNMSINLLHSCFYQLNIKNELLMRLFSSLSNIFTSSEHIKSEEDSLQPHASIQSEPGWGEW